MVEVVFWGHEADGRGTEISVCHQPDTLLSPEQRALGIEVEQFAPPSPPTEYWGWEAYVDLASRTLVWEPKALPVTTLAFRRLFTLAERLAIKAGAGLDAEQALMLAVLNDDLMAAQHIELGDPDTVMGVNWLESVGLIGEGRAAQILAGTLPG